MINQYVFWILVLIVLTQFAVSQIIIVMTKKNSIESRGPRINQELSLEEIYSYENRGCSIDTKSYVLVFFDPSCRSCKDLFYELGTQNIDISQVHFVTFGEETQISTIVNETKIKNLHVIEQSTMLNKLRISAFPMAIKVSEGTVSEKDFASFSNLESMIGET